jgi:hypothetical protein
MADEAIDFGIPAASRPESGFAFQPLWPQSKDPVHDSGLFDHGPGVAHRACSWGCPAIPADLARGESISSPLTVRDHPAQPKPIDIHRCAGRTQDEIT